MVPPPQLTHRSGSLALKPETALHLQQFQFSFALLCVFESRLTLETAEIRKRGLEFWHVRRAEVVHLFVGRVVGLAAVAHSRRSRLGLLRLLWLPDPMGAGARGGYGVAILGVVGGVVLGVAGAATLGVAIVRGSGGGLPDRRDVRLALSHGLLGLLIWLFFEGLDYLCMASLMVLVV